jgi:hypothetical protein
MILRTHPASLVVGLVVLASLALSSACAKQAHVPSVPVVAATVALSYETATQCQFRGALAVYEFDAVGYAKQAAAATGANLVLTFNDEVNESAEYSEETGKWQTEAEFVSAKLVFCPEPVRESIMSGAKVLDTR